VVNGAIARPDAGAGRSRKWQNLLETGDFSCCVNMILDISQLQHHVTARMSEFVRDKAIAPHRARKRH
jgi:hypothetical protein